MSSYNAALSQCFAYSITLPIPVVKECCLFLLVHDQESSFAVTVDTSPGKWRLWLSDTSYKELEEAGIL